MNPREYFEITHYRVFVCPTVPEQLVPHLRTYNNCTVTLSSLQSRRRHPLFQLKQVSEPIYYILNGVAHVLSKKEHEAHFFQGEQVLLLGVIRYKGMYEIETANVQVVVDLKRRNKQQHKQQNRTEGIKENDEIFILNEINIDELDEYVFSYFISYRHKQISQQHQIPEEMRIEKRNVFEIKAEMPFTSIYAFITDSFPIVYIEYQCTNVAGQPLEFRDINFRLEPFMKLERYRIGSEPIVLYKDESVRLVFKVLVQLDNMAALAKVLTKVKDQSFDYELKVGGGIFLDWGVCGKYNGQPKLVKVNIQPIVARFEDGSQVSLEKDKITKLSVDIQLGIFFPPSGAEILIRLEESEMRGVKIVGIDRMKITYDQYVRVNTVTISVVGTSPGIGQIRGLNFLDSYSQKPISYKNQLHVIVLNPQEGGVQTPQLSQKVSQLQMEDLLIDQFEPLPTNSKQQSTQPVGDYNLLDIDSSVQQVDLI